MADRPGGRGDTESWAGLAEGRVRPRPPAGRPPSGKEQALGRGQRLLPGLRREEAVPAGAKGEGQGLQASSRCTVPGPPPLFAGAAAGSYRLPTHPRSRFCVSRCLSLPFL